MIGVVLRNRLTQRGGTQRIGVLSLPGLRSGLQGGDHGGWRGEVWLAHAEVNHIAPLRLQGCCRFHDFHNVERRNLVEAMSELHYWPRMNNLSS